MHCDALEGAARLSKRFWNTGRFHAFKLETERPFEDGSCAEGLREGLKRQTPRMPRSI
jgi:hypothetical protein